MGENKKGKKALKVISIVMLSIIGFFVVVIAGVNVWFRAPMGSYYAASEKAFTIPGLSANFVPQGFCYDEVEKQYLMSGYDSTGKASSIYVVHDEKDSQQVPTKRVALAKSIGDIFDGHCGGVAQNGDYVYVANGSRIYVFSYADVKNAQDGDSVRYLGYKSITNDYDDVNASFVHTSNGKLYVGEFHDGKNYIVSPEHEITTQNGDVLYALMLEFDLDATAQYGIAQDPTRAFAIPNKVQGVCVEGDYIYCSTSYGLSFSQIYKFDLTKSVNEGPKSVLGKDTALYSLDSVSLEKIYKTAPMSEELVYKDGKLYIMSEFACNKYIMGKFVEGQYCYATDLDKM